MTDPMTTPDTCPTCGATPVTVGTSLSIVTRDAYRHVCPSTPSRDAIEALLRVGADPEDIAFEDDGFDR